MFISLNELHMAKNGEAYFLSLFLAMLSIAKLYAPAAGWVLRSRRAWRLLYRLAGVSNAAGQRDSCPGIAGRKTTPGRLRFLLGRCPFRRVTPWPGTLAARQALAADRKPVCQLVGGWIILLILALIAVIQLYTTM